LDHPSLGHRASDPRDGRGRQQGPDRGGGRRHRRCAEPGGGVMRTMRACSEASMTRSVLAVLATAAAILCWQHGAGAQARCPLTTADACDQWHLEQIDKQLAQVVAEAVEKIEKFAHPDARQEAKDALAESQRAFVTSREADCRAEAAFMYLRT